MTIFLRFPFESFYKKQVDSTKVDVWKISESEVTCFAQKFAGFASYWSGNLSS